MVRFALVFCALLSAEAAAQTGPLVGKTKAYLLSCAGIPSASMTSDGIEYFSYSTARSRGGTIHMNQWGHGFMTSNSDACTITFQIRKGRIVSSTQKSSGGIFTGPMMCGRILSGCQE